MIPENAVSNSIFGFQVLSQKNILDLSFARSRQISRSHHISNKESRKTKNNTRSRKSVSSATSGIGRMTKRKLLG